MTSYEQLPQAMRDKLDEVLEEARRGHVWSIGPAQTAYLRESIANLVLVCLLLDKQAAVIPHITPEGGPCSVCGEYTHTPCSRCGRLVCALHRSRYFGRTLCATCREKEEVRL